MSKIIENNKEFPYTAEQLLFAEAYVRLSGSVSAVGRKLGNPITQKYYRWKKQDGFDDWLSAYAKEEVLKRQGRWYLIAEKFAEKGSFQHLNMLMQIAKEFLPAPLIESHTHFTNIDVKELEDKSSKELVDIILGRHIGTNLRK